MNFGMDIGRLGETTVSRWSAAVLLGNLGDALSTLTFLQLHLAHEMNPLMRLAYQISPMSFMVTKLALVHLGLLLLYLNRHVRAARIGEAFGGMIYIGIMAWHLVCWAGLGRAL